MTQTDPPQTTYRLPEQLADDLDKLRAMVGQVKAGELSGPEFRAFRVPLGVYEQRRDGTFMLRVRLPAGGALPHQLRKLADVSEEFGNGVLHVTTRQDIQVHDVLVDDMHPALVSLAESGLSTKGGGGNTVRNITACCDAGVCPEEEFDVSPYATALTEFLLPDPLSYQLPRKYKIAFSGCARDCAGATVHDVGFVSRKRGEELGFAVCVGGGLGSGSRVADLFEEFVPASEIHLVAEAVKRVFDKHGDRKNRHKARLRFLVERAGLEHFRELYEAELAKLRRSGVPALEPRELPARDRPASQGNGNPTAGLDEWRERNVLPQKQAGYHLVRLSLFLGDIRADRLRALADIVEEHGEGLLRATQSQNLVLQWVHTTELPHLHRKLDPLGLAHSSPRVLRDLIACAGASTCRLGICLSRGLAKAIHNGLGSSDLDLDGLGDLKIHVSGCPNSCGRHPIADIGLYGAARRIDGRLVPHYVVQLGGRVGEGTARLAEGRYTVPARLIPGVLAAFLKAYLESPEHPDYAAFLDSGGRELMAELAELHRDVAPFEEDKNHYYDWDAEELFSLAGRGAGECSAGVFELFAVDLSSARDAVVNGDLFAATALAARALLITKGQEARSDAEALKLFTESFVDAGLVGESHRGLIQRALERTGKANSRPAFEGAAEEVTALVDAVQGLYDNMDPALRFQPAAETADSSPSGCACRTAACCSTGSDVVVDREADLRGVACPLNYVKTKLLLEQMDSGQVLSILLGEDGAQNVPQSAEKDGHQALSVVEEGDAWRVMVQKG